MTVRLEPGALVDRYRVEAPIGEGGMASVWRVRHVVLDSPHALKVLRPELVVRPELRERFLAEGRIQAWLRHPNIAAVTDVVAEEGIAGLILELLEGRTLEQRLVEDGPLAPAEALEVFLPVLDALAWAHDHGVVHRDLKPANLFLAAGTRGRVRPVLLDFGVASLREEARRAGSRTRMTEAGVRVGTVHYMSPEQVRDARDVDARSDVFAMGAALYEALLGRLAFPGESEFEVGQRITAGHFADPGPLLEPAARPLAEVVRRCLAVRPEDRFPDAWSLAEALERSVRGAVPAPEWARRPAPSTDAKGIEVPAPAPPPARAVDASDAGAWIESGDGQRHAVAAPGVMLHGLRGTVEPLPRVAARFSHARVVPGPGGWWVEPHGVALSVRVDGDRLLAPRLLRDGARVELDAQTWRFRVPAP